MTHRPLFISPFVVSATRSQLPSLARKTKPIIVKLLSLAPTHRSPPLRHRACMRCDTRGTRIVVIKPIIIFFDFMSSLCMRRGEASRKREEKGDRYEAQTRLKMIPDDAWKWRNKQHEINLITFDDVWNKIVYFTFEKCGASSVSIIKVSSTRQKASALRLITYQFWCQALFVRN